MSNNNKTEILQGSPTKIYSIVLRNVDNLILSFSDTSQSEEIVQAQSEAQAQLKALQNEILKAMQQLQKNAEWDTFTIAFYGETNAGKSPLIETLRILLEEPTKLRDRQEFEMLKHEYLGTQEQIKQRRRTIADNETECAEKIAAINVRVSAFDDEILNLAKQQQDIETQIGHLQDVMKEKKRSLWQKIKLVFGKISEQKEIKSLKQDTIKLKGKRISLLQKQGAEKQAIAGVENECKQKNAAINNSIEKLAEMANLQSQQIVAKSDGRIIGDGRSDFTRDVLCYEFERNGQKFAILDLPGIEGNEGLVLDNINAAVQKAHAVFYVTSAAHAPQTGDNGQGTLEKIKAHLGQQTEVYTIFNKRATSPNSLQIGLINEGEKESLKVLDKTMREHLGEQYQECIALCAYPAFLSVANCCWENDYSVKRKKFLEHFPEQVLLEMTFLPSFCSRLTERMVNDSMAKIKRSNFKKATTVIDNTKIKIKDIHQNILHFEQQLIQTKANTDKHLDSSLHELKRNLELQGSNAVAKLKNTVRKAVYEEIERDISDSDFKTILESNTKNGIQKMQENLSVGFQREIENFQRNVAGSIKKFEKYAEELMNVSNGANRIDTSFELKINLKSGINWGGLLSSAIGIVGSAIFMVSNPVGWVFLALSIIGALISVGKAVAKFFSTKFKQSEQRKSTDKSVDAVGKKLQAEIEKNFKAPFLQLNAGIKSIKDELQKSISHVKELNRILLSAQSKFAVLSKEIETESKK
jgi:hypothetical protein